MKGRTRWFPRHVHPVREGFYECLVRLAGGTVTTWQLEWDGKGFLCPIPMFVYHWRGVTKKVFQEATK